MRKYFVLLWLLLPLPVVVLHFGRGQQWLARDIAHDRISEAEAAEQAEDWKKADDLYAAADKEAGGDDRELKLRLDMARVRMRFHMGEAVAAIDGADRLLDDPRINDMPAEFQREARELSGRIHYYAGWVMRREGAKRELWMEEAELSRQSYRMVAEQDADEVSAEKGRKQREDLEAAVQLQRLSLTELMARPLPKEGQGMSGQGLSEQMAKRRGQRGKNPGKGPQGKGPPDKGAGLERFQPGEGS